jgi:ribose transport system substrate-binding protein
MKRAAWRMLPIVVFGVLLVGTLAINISLVNRSRNALASTILRNPATVRTARFHIVAILPDTIDPFYVHLIEGLREESERQNAALQLFYYTSTAIGEVGSTSEEVSRWFEIALRSKADGIILFQPTGMDVRRFAQKAESKHVPFVPLAMDAPQSWTRSGVTGDSFSQGKEAGTLVLGLLGTVVRVGIILSSDTSLGYAFDEEPFYRGVQEGLKARPGAAIVAAVREEESILGGEDACARMLTEHPDINAIVCIDAKATIGAAQVIIDRGKVGQIVIIGADENAEVNRLIERGVVHASIVRDATTMGQAGISLIVGQLIGIRAPERISVGYHVIPTRGGSP